MSTYQSKSMVHIKPSCTFETMPPEIFHFIGDYLPWTRCILFGQACKYFYECLKDKKHLRINWDYSAMYIVNEEFRQRVSACVKDPYTQIDGYYELHHRMRELRPLAPNVLRIAFHPYNRYAINDGIVDLSHIPNDDPFPFNHDNGGEPFLLSDSSSDEDNDSDFDSEDHSDSTVVPHVNEDDEEEDIDNTLSPSQLAWFHEEIIAICNNLDLDVPLDTVTTV